MRSLAVVVPVKDFARSKGRLRDAGVPDVESISRRLAGGVIAAASPYPVFVACESSIVADFALELGARALLSNCDGLNEAVTSARIRLRGDFETIVVAHADLLIPEGLGSFQPTSDVVVVTDEAGRGTNVLAVPSTVDFTFHFGPDSASAHIREAERRGLSVTVVTDSPWRFDVDEASDLPS